jgi:hypothetical protein
MAGDQNRRGEVMTISAGTTYKWAFPQTGDATLAFQALETVKKEQGGRLTPESVVEKARMKESYLHRYFEWDDTKAGHEHRKQQARTLIRSIVEVRQIKDDSKKSQSEIKVYVNTSSEKTRYYQSYNVLTQDEFDYALKQLRVQVFSLMTEVENLEKVANGKYKSDIAVKVKKATEKYKSDILPLFEAPKGKQPVK